MKPFDVFTQAYLACALWSSTDHNGTPLDQNYNISDIAPETLENMVKDCADFQLHNWDLISDDLSQAGHDFWLTRNRHGAGFWDSARWPTEIGDKLTICAHGYGETDLYIGDDNKLYI